MIASKFMLRVGTPVLAMLIALSSVAHAQAPKVSPAVAEHFNRGNELYQEGKYASALVEYDEAYNLSLDEKGRKNWKILYNRGQCLVMLGREPEGIASFQQYLDEGGDQIDAERRKQVEADIRKLKARLGTVILEGTMPNGSEVLLDGRTMGRTPLPGPLVAATGVHDLVVKPPGGGQPYVASVIFKSGEQIAHRVVMTVAGPTPEPLPTAPYVDTPPPPPLPPPVLPVRPLGGLPAPAWNLGLQLGTSLPAPDYRFGQRHALVAGELAIAWRASGFWELGLFGGLATGRYTIDDSVRTRSDPSTGEVVVDPNAGYTQGIVGLRVRMHLVRMRRFDGWLGVDGGGWFENWRFTGAKSSFRYRASSPAFGIGFGGDVQLTPRWAMGLAARFLVASASNGERYDCTNVDCVRGFLPGEGADGYSQSTGRGFFELGLRLVYLIPTGGQPSPAPPAKPGASATASLPALLF